MLILAIEQGEREFKMEGYGVKNTFFIKITIGTRDLDNLVTFTMFDETIERSNRRFSMLTALAELDGGEFERFDERDE